MSSRIFLATLGVAFAISSTGPAAAQNVVDAPLGTTFKEKAALGPRQIPLPPGEWTLLSRSVGRSGTTGGAASIPVVNGVLVQYQDGKLSRWIMARTNMEVSAYGWSRSRDVCDRGDVHVSVSDTNYNAKETECWTVNHVGLTPGSNAADFIRAFYDQTAGKGRPVTALSARYFLVRDSSYVDVAYYSNPELAGFEKTPTADWRGNPWHRDMAAQDPKKLDYIAKVKAEGEALLPLIKRGMANRL